MTRALTTTDYYEIFELALSSLSENFDEYRRHFGLSPRPAPPGYCWFKTVTAPERHRDYLAWLSDAGTALEDQLLAAMPRLKPQSMLDVGCGNGALLRRLSRIHPAVSLAGINFQRTQAATARRILAGTGTEIIEADFLTHAFARRYDVAYMLESAFHMPDKPQLCRRLADVLVPGGEAWLIDIVIAERAAETFQSLGRGALFNYVPRADWQSASGAAGFEEVEFVDLSRSVTDVLQVSDNKLLERDYFTPRLAAALPSDAPERAEQLRSAVEVMLQIATEYRRLARLFRGGMLEYVLMRHRKRT